MLIGAPRLAGLCGLALAATSLVVASTSATVQEAQEAPVTCRGLAATMVGTEGADKLDGTEGPDVIVGLGGPDRIRGGGGNDVICGGEGSDDLRGGPGNDRLYGQRDLLDFRESSGGAVWYVLIGDRLAGGPGNDHLDAGKDPRPDDVEEPDTVAFGGTHGVVLRLAGEGGLGSAFGEGHDTVVGQSGLAIEGSPGPDRIWGSQGPDVISGGPGDDVIRGRSGDDDISDGGSKDSPDRDVLLGGQGRDRLSSNFGADAVYGGPDPDAITNFSRKVRVMRGGAGGDEIFHAAGGYGCPVVAGGNGKDTFTIAVPRKITKPVFRIVLDGEINGCGSVLNVEYLQLDSGRVARWDVVGTDGPDSVYVALEIPLTAHLRGGDDRAIGNERDDFLVGGAGNDYADGWNGTDTCRGFETVQNCEVT